MIKVCEEDECAPDALEYFSKAVEKETGVSLHYFKQTAVRTMEDEYEIKWEFGNYLLLIAADYPFYILFKKE